MLTRTVMTQSPPARRYSVLALDPPLSPARLAACKSLRLTSLQLDPRAFVSNYAREAAFTEDIWRQRFDSLLSRTLVAIASPSESVNTRPSELDERPPGASESAAGDSPAETKMRTETGGEWIGTATVVCPSGIPPDIFAPFKAAGVGADWEIYGLYAMWIHPAHRGEGVGVQLVEACLDWVRAWHIDDPATLSGADRQKVVALLVYDDNIAGRALYSRTGFADLSGVVSAEEGQRWMIFKL